VALAVGCAGGCARHFFALTIFRGAVPFDSRVSPALSESFIGSGMALACGACCGLARTATPDGKNP